MRKLSEELFPKPPAGGTVGRFFTLLRFQVHLHQKVPLIPQQRCLVVGLCDVTAARLCVSARWRTNALNQ